MPWVKIKTEVKKMCSLSLGNSVDELDRLRVRRMTRCGHPLKGNSRKKKKRRWMNLLFAPSFLVICVCVFANKHPFV